MGNIVLIGFMGCGKSAVGRALARERALKFVDTDEEVERSAGKRISQIFAESGEAEFRRLEREAIGRVAALDELVIATGGGAVLDPENVRALKANGRLIWIDAPAGTLWQRVRRNRDRPLLQRPHPYETLKALYRERRPIYRAAADASVVSRGSVYDVAARIWEVLDGA
ncbi:MAG TPA: shikimate kinase [Limnochordia bacterium]|nr:shikimate kinase [Limnochordia bacterium]